MSVRTGKVITDLNDAAFQALQAGQCLAHRDRWLDKAREESSPAIREQRIQYARDAHRQMLARLRLAGLRS